MKQPSAMEGLDIRIKELELRYEEQMADLRSAAAALMDSMSPMHLLKNTLKDVVNTPGLKGNLIDTAVGMGAGFLGKKLFVNKSGGLFKKMTGSALQFLLTSFVSRKLHEARDDHSRE